MSRRDVSLSGHAEESIAFIRATIARSAGFTAVPGRGGIGMGAIGVAGAMLAHGRPVREWLTVWLAAAVAAVAVGLVAMWRKADAAGVPLLSGSARKFAHALLPAFVAAIALTADAVAGGRADRLPGTWLLLYGAGILAAASASIPMLSGMGLGFMAIGALALVAPPEWGDACLAAGFGGIHVICGWIIARKYGG